MRTPIQLVAAALVLAGALSACGGGSSSTAADRTATLGSSIPSSTATVTQTVPTPTTTTTTSSASACTAADLGLSFAGSNGAAGTIVFYLKIHDTGSAPCHTFGYPGVEFLARDGSGLNTVTTRTIHDVLGNTPEAPVVLGPGQAASFRMVASTVGPASICSNAYGLQVIPPDDTASLHVAFPNGIFQCGKTTVSPLEPGTGAIPAGT